MQNTKMPAEHYNSIALLEDEYWWHQIRYKLVLSALKLYGKSKQNPLIGDLGCGLGGLIRKLRSNYYHNVVGYEYDSEIVNSLIQDGICAYQQDLEGEMMLTEGPFDIITALDVMEHIQDDNLFLTKINNNLKPDGLAIITVPAFSFLVSKWDYKLGHLRRYNRKQIINLAKECGFEVVKATYFFAFVFPMVLMRKWSDTFRSVSGCEFPSVPHWVNKLLLLFGYVERCWLEFLPLPFGTSLLLIVKK